MSLERSEHFLVRFNGKNYFAWAFQFQFFVKGKELWGHIDGTDLAPNIEKEKEKYVKWEVKDAQVMSWILGSVELSILLNLRPYKTFREMWEYLKKIYNQSNIERRFQLELELGPVKGVCQSKSFILPLEIFGLITLILCMQVYLLKDSLLSKVCMGLASVISF